jgi:hypothetical protein
MSTTYEEEKFLNTASWTAKLFSGYEWLYADEQFSKKLLLIGVEVTKN